MLLFPSSKTPFVADIQEGKESEAKLKQETKAKPVSGGRGGWGRVVLARNVKSEETKNSSDQKPSLPCAPTSSLPLCPSSVGDSNGALSVPSSSGSQGNIKGAKANL